MFKLIFWKDAGERAIKTFAQTAVTMLTASTVNLMTLDILNVLYLCLFAAVISILSSVATVTLGATNSASLVVKVEDPTTAVEKHEDIVDDIV